MWPRVLVPNDTLFSRLETLNIIYSKFLQTSLPDPKGSLSSRLSSQAIALEVEKVRHYQRERQEARQCTWITDQQGCKQVEVAGLRTQWQTSVVSCSIDASFCPCSEINGKKKIGTVFFFTWNLQHNFFPIYGTLYSNTVSIL